MENEDKWGWMGMERGGEEGRANLAQESIVFLFVGDDFDGAHHAAGGDDDSCERGGDLGGCHFRIGLLPRLWSGLCRCS